MDWHDNKLLNLNSMLFPVGMEHGQVRWMATLYANLCSGLMKREARFGPIVWYNWLMTRWNVQDVVDGGAKSTTESTLELSKACVKA